MYWTNWDIAFWLAGFIGNAALVSVLIVRRRFRVFPCFTLLIFSDLLQSPALLLMHLFSSHTQYSDTYWALDAIDTVLRVCLVFELAKVTAKNIGVARSGIIRDYYVALIFSLTVAAAFGWNRSINLWDWNEVMIHLSFGADILIEIATVFLILQVFFYDLKLRMHAAIISYGMFAFISAKLLVHWTVAFEDAGVWAMFERGLKPLYMLCLLTWAIFLWLDEPKIPVGEEMHRLLFKSKSAIEKVARLSVHQPSDAV